jgi:uncharacterized phage protein (TIGR01671 family)
MREIRQILFRGKDEFGWIYGDLVHEGNEIGIKTSEGIFIVPAETVGQYTGLKDKNGKKIFEGDLIDDSVWSVAYCDGEGEFCGMQAGWYVQRDGWESWYGLAYDTLAEVIGNIHDNNLE